MTTVCSILSIIVIVVTIYHDITKGGIWFQRSGGIVTALGTFLLIWNIFRDGEIKTSSNSVLIEPEFTNGDPRNTLENSLKKVTNIIIDTRTIKIGTIITIIGAIISSFGDLI